MIIIYGKHNFRGNNWKLTGGVETIIAKKRSQCFKDYGFSYVTAFVLCVTASKTASKKKVPKNEGNKQKMKVIPVPK